MKIKGFRTVKKMTLKQVEKKYAKLAEQMRNKGKTAVFWLKDKANKLHVVFKSKGKPAQPYAPTALSGLPKAEQSDLFNPRQEFKMYRGKIQDVGEVAPGGLLEEYWHDHIENAHWQDGHGRTGKKIPRAFKYYDPRAIYKTFKLKFIEFGNWLNQQDRLDYTAGLGLGLYDLATVLGISKTKLSMKGKLGIALGSRGVPRSLAHFEPKDFFINVNRHPDIDKKAKLYSLSGAGSLAHEYGHALDYFVGGKTIKGKEIVALSKELDYTTYGIFLKDKSPLALMQNLLYVIKYGEIPTLKPYKQLSPEAKARADKQIVRANKKHPLANLNKYVFVADENYKLKDTPYLKRLKSAASLSAYFRKPQEIFARAFESYVWALMAQKGITNSFLQRKRTGSAYLRANELDAVMPQLKALITSMKKYL